MNQALVRGISTLVLLVHLVPYHSPIMERTRETSGTRQMYGTSLLVLLVRPFSKIPGVFKREDEGYRCLGKSLVSDIFLNSLHPLALEYASFAPTGT